MNMCRGVKKSLPIIGFVFLLTTCLNVLKIIYDSPVKYYFDDFGIWLLGYKTEFSYLYISQGLYFISTLLLWSTDEYVKFCFWAKVHL